MAVRPIGRVLALAVAVLAAGTTQKAQAQNWDGSGLVRFGVFLQGSFIDYDIRQVSPLTGVPLNQSASPNGWGVGIAAGYDLRLGSFIIGAEADVSWDDGSSKARPNTQENYGIDYFATLRGRLGYVVHPAFTIYATVGYSLIGAEYKQEGLAAGGGVAGPGFKKYGTLDGIVYGGGMEYDLGWGIGFVEYLHSDISGWSFRSFSGNQVSVDGSQDVIRLGLKFKVGHDYGHDVYKAPGSLK